MYIQKMPVTYQVQITPNIYYESMPYYMRKLVDEYSIEVKYSWPEYQILELRSELALWLDYQITEPSDLVKFYDKLVDVTT